MRKGEVYQSKKEHEARIGEYRVARGMTVSELAVAVGLANGNFSPFQNGMVSPLYIRGSRAGKPKPIVNRLCEFFGVSVADLFPRYMCEIKRWEFPVDSLVPCQVLVNSISMDSINQSKSSGDLLWDLQGIMEGYLSEVERMIVVRRYYVEDSLEEIAVDLGCSRQYVNQMEQKAMGILRRVCKRRMGGGK